MLRTRTLATDWGAHGNCLGQVDVLHLSHLSNATSVKLPTAEYATNAVVGKGSVPAIDSPETPSPKERAKTFLPRVPATQANGIRVPLRPRTGPPAALRGSI